jgi:hypothetical protein
MRAMTRIAVVIVALVGCGSEKSGGKAGSAEAVAVDLNAPTQAEREALAACDFGKMQATIEQYNTDRHYLASVRGGTAYQSKCKRAPRLDWDILYALEALDRWKEAEAISDRLVKEQPTDSDYWWWRAKDRRHLGQNERAVADLRQSLTDAGPSSNGVQVDHMEAAAKPIDRPCETAFALRWLANLGVDLVESAKRQFNEIFLDAHCRRLDGHGTLTWAASGMKRTKLDGKIGDRKIVVMIDGGLGTTLVRSDVADAAKLARGAQVDVLTPTGVGVGAASTADVFAGAASALEVPVAIVDKLPEGIDAVVGLSFLWRFEVKADGDKNHATRPLDD